MYLGRVQKLRGSGCFPLSRLAGFRPAEAVLVPNTSVLWVIFLSVLRSESIKRDVFSCAFSWNEFSSSWWLLWHPFPCTRFSPLCWPWPQVARIEGAEARVKALRLLWRSGPGLEIELGVKEAWSRSTSLKSYWRVLELWEEFNRLWKNQKLGGA